MCLLTICISSLEKCLFMSFRMISAPFSMGSSSQDQVLHLVFMSHQPSLLLFGCSVMSDSVTPWTAACQASLSFTISFFNLEYFIALTLSFMTLTSLKNISCLFFFLRTFLMLCAYRMILIIRFCILSLNVFYVMHTSRTITSEGT